MCSAALSVDDHRCSLPPGFRRAGCTRRGSHAAAFFVERGVRPSQGPGAGVSLRDLRAARRAARDEDGAPKGVHVLTAIHGVGSVVCAVLSAGSAVSVGFRQSLARTGGSRLMVAFFGDWTWAFLLFIAGVLGTLSYGSWNRRRYTWPLTLAVYSVGVLGSLWQVSVGIDEAWVSAVINAGVVAYAASPGVRRAYGWRSTE